MGKNKKRFTVILLNPYLLCLIALFLLNARGCFEKSSTIENEGDVVITSTFYLSDIIYNGVDESKDEQYPDQSSCHYSLSTEYGEYITTYLRFVTYYMPQDTFIQLDVNYWILENEDYCYLTDTLGNTLSRVQINTNDNVGKNNGVVFEVRMKTGITIPIHVPVKLYCYQKNECSKLRDQYRCCGTIDIFNKKVVDFSGLTGRKIHVIIDTGSAKTKNFTWVCS